MLTFVLPFYFCWLQFFFFLLILILTLVVPVLIILFFFFKVYLTIMEHLSTVELVEKPSRTSSSSLPFALPEKRGVDSFSFVTSSRNTQDDTSSFDSFILRTSADYSKPKWILLPDDNIRRAWELLIVFILIYIAIAVPIRMAFLISESYFLIFLILIFSKKKKKKNQ